MKLTVYNVENEEPKCGRCEHCNEEDLCMKYCGPAHDWSGYERIVEEEE